MCIFTSQYTIGIGNCMNASAIKDLHNTLQVILESSIKIAQAFRRV